ncbi:MAG TPA: antitoxin VapB family protein [Candidatus Nanoarchaeia archaeon]|nr:antitoxin VapB family protein [Candidatus Nanoarchaeia archaeon]
MAVKTITITTHAYDTLKTLKEPRESFSDVIVRVAGKRSLREFIGCISEATAEKMEKAIKESRQKHAEVHRKRMDAVIKAFKE